MFPGAAQGEEIATTICPLFAKQKIWDVFSIAAEGADRSHLHGAPDSHDVLVTPQKGQVTAGSDVAPKCKLRFVSRALGKMYKHQSLEYLNVFDQCRSLHLPSAWQARGSLHAQSLLF